MARSDSERLDWIATKPGLYWSGHGWEEHGLRLSEADVVSRYTCIVDCAANLREAIDAAMDAESDE